MKDRTKSEQFQSSFRTVLKGRAISEQFQCDFIAAFSHWAITERLQSSFRAALKAYINLRAVSEQVLHARAVSVQF